MTVTQQNQLHSTFNKSHILLSVDTEKIYTDVTQAFVGPYGKTFEWSVKVKLMGKPELVAAQTLVDELQLPLEAEEVNQRLKEETFKQFPFAPILPGLDNIKKIEIIWAELNRECTPKWRMEEW